MDQDDRIGVEKKKSAEDQSVRCHMLSKAFAEETALKSPPVLFFDEPTTGLDPETRRSIWAILQAQQAEGKTAIITTHSMEEADVSLPPV